MKKITHSKKKQQQSISKKVAVTQQNSFHKLLSRPELNQVIGEYMNNFRDRQYAPTTTLSMFVYQMLTEDASCQNTVNMMNVERIKNGSEPYSSQTGGYCMARQRLSLEMIMALVKKSGKRLSTTAPPEWLWQNRRVKLADGTTILLPDTHDNQAYYPQHGQQTEGVGFPIVRLVAVLCLSTGGVLGLDMGAYKGKGTGEHSLFRRLLNCFEKGDILLADRYYASFFLVAELMARGVDVVLEQHGARKTDFRKGKKLSARDHIVPWKRPKKPEWMTQEEYKSYPESLEVREVKVGKKVLITTMLSKKVAPKKSLEQLYLSRWHIELDLRNIKTTLGMEILSCKTAQMCQKELWVYMLGYNLIRIMMSESAVRSGMLPREISFKHTLQIWMAWVTDPCAVFANQEEQVSIFQLIAEVRVGNRPGRVEPRAVKRRPKPYPRLKNPRSIERENIKKYGHAKKMAA